MPGEKKNEEELYAGLTQNADDDWVDKDGTVVYRHQDAEYDHSQASSNVKDSAQSLVDNSYFSKRMLIDTLVSDGYDKQEVTDVVSNELDVDWSSEADEAAKDYKENINPKATDEDVRGYLAGNQFTEDEISHVLQGK